MSSTIAHVSLPSPEAKSPPHWTAAYIGKPYRAGANGPDAFDCWGIGRHHYAKQFGIAIPSMPLERLCLDHTNLRIFEDALDGDWDEIDMPEEHCGVALARCQIITHVGLWTWADGGRVLHMQGNRFVVTQSIPELRAELWSVVKFYRHKQLPC